MKFAHVVVCAAVGVLVVGCDSPVAGSAAAAGTPSAAATATPGTSLPEITTRTSPATTTGNAGGMPPTTVDESLPAQYCDGTFDGALGKPMHAVVVQTPGGVLGCDEAGAVLFDYYTERPDPRVGLDPVHIGPLVCNQAEEGQLAQVICADSDNLIYSMWPQS